MNDLVVIDHFLTKDEGHEGLALGQELKSKPTKFVAQSYYPFSIKYSHSVHHYFEDPTKNHLTLMWSCGKIAKQTVLVFTLCDN